MSQILKNGNVVFEVTRGIDRLSELRDCWIRFDNEARTISVETRDQVGREVLMRLKDPQFSANICKFSFGIATGSLVRFSNIEVEDLDS